MAKKPKVCIIGAESWGSAISTAVCKNVLKGEFDEKVHIYVYDELVRSNYLSEVINERHENIKYLPGIKLECNLIAVNDLVEAAKDADILIFATSHSFIRPYCNILTGKVKSTAYAISLIRGLEHIKDGEIDLYSHLISRQLNIPCYSMMSANSAMEMAQGKLSEITIGCNNVNHAHQLSNLFQTDNCKVFSVDDVDGVELCNTLKDLVALSAGFIDGLRLGENARVACLHLGLKEMMRFIKTFNPNTKISTFFESCGLANSVASSYADKNVTFAKCFVISRKTVQEIEANLLNGRKLLGPIVAGEIFSYLEKFNLQDKYPLFTVLHRICQNEVPPDAIIDILRKHPDLRNNSITQMQKDEYELPISFADSVLENFVDVVPELGASPAQNPIYKQLIDNANTRDDQVQKALQPFTIEDENIEKSGMETTALDADKPNKGDVEFSFEIAASDDKPEIHLTLRELIDNSPTKVHEHPWLHSQNKDLDVNLTSAVGISHSPKEATSAEYLSIKRQPAEMAHSGADKLDGEKPTVGLGNFIRRHINPINETYKALKVRAKISEDDKVAKSKKETSRPALSAKEHPSEKTDSTLKLSESAKQGFESAGQKQKEKSSEQKQVLYDENPTYAKRFFVEEPSVSKLFDMMRLTRNQSYEENLINHSLKAKKQTDSKKNTISNRDKIEDEASENVVLSKKEGYNVDNMRVIKPNKTHSKTDQHGDNKNISNELPFVVRKAGGVPIQYSKTDNSYSATKSDLESKNFSQTEYQTIDYEQSKHLNLEKEEEPKLTFGVNDTENTKDNFKDAEKLTRAQEFLDEQSQLIKNLLWEVTASDSEFNRIMSEKEHSKYQIHETKNEPQLARPMEEENFLSLDEQKPSWALKDSSNHEMENSQLRHKESKKQSTELNRVPGQQIVSYLEGEQKNKNEYSNMAYEDDPDLSTKQLLDNKKKLLEKPFSNESDNGTLGQDKYEMLIEKHFSKPSLKPLHDNHSVDDGVEGNSMAYEDHRLSALTKKSQVHGYDDPNLRFYHGKNDGEQGPEWNWLLEKTEEDLEKQLNKGKLINQTESKNIGQELDAHLPLNSYQAKHISQKKSGRKKSNNQTDNNEVSQEHHSARRSTAYSDPSVDKDAALHQAHFIGDEDIQESTEMKGRRPIKFEGSTDEIFIDEVNPIAQSLEKVLSHESPSNDPIYAKHTANEDVDVMLQDEAEITAVETTKSDRTVSGLNEQQYEVMTQAVNDFKKILDEVELKYNSSNGLEKNKMQSLDTQLTESLDQDEKKYETNPDFEDSEFDKVMSTLMSKGQSKERQVDYSGNNPYLNDVKILPRPPSTVSDTKGQQDGSMRKKIVVRPSFHPPINPRIRIPRPPFDVRDQEYHTLNYHPPPNLMQKAALPLRKIPLSYRSQQTAAGNVVKLPRPAMRLPTSMMRSSVLAVQVGIFAAFFSRYRGTSK